MKIATGNRLNEFWEELNGVLVPKSKVLKTLEEVEANTNEENIAGATALKEVNNKLANGRVELVVTEDGKLGYKLDGADTVHPFSDPKFLQLVSTNRYTQTNSGTLGIPLAKGDYLIATAMIATYGAIQDGYVCVPTLSNANSVCGVSSGTVNRMSNNLYHCSLKQDGNVNITFGGYGSQTNCAAIIFAVVISI